MLFAPMAGDESTLYGSSCCQSNAPVKLLIAKTLAFVVDALQPNTVPAASITD